MNKVPYLDSLDTWQAVFDDRQPGRALVIVKLSPVCGLSHTAERIVDGWLSAFPPPGNFDVYKVDVIADRALSEHMERVLGVRHESPQVLWLGDDGSVKWHASHRAISLESLQAQSRAVEVPPDET